MYVMLLLGMHVMNHVTASVAVGVKLCGRQVMLGWQQGVSV